MATMVVILGFTLKQSKCPDNHNYFDVYSLFVIQIQEERFKLVFSSFIPPPPLPLSMHLVTRITYQVQSDLDFRWYRARAQWWRRRRPCLCPEAS